MTVDARPTAPTGTPVGSAVVVQTWGQALDAFEAALDEIDRRVAAGGPGRPELPTIQGAVESRPSSAEQQRAIALQARAVAAEARLRDAMAAVVDELRGTSRRRDAAGAYASQGGGLSSY